MRARRLRFSPSACIMEATPNNQQRRTNMFLYNSMLRYRSGLAKKVALLVLLALNYSSPFAFATSAQNDRITRFSLPENGDIVGQLRTVYTRQEDTLIDIAKHYGLGYEAIRAANPDVDAWLPGEGTAVALPNMHLLPDSPRMGIVVNVAEMRLYYYPLEKQQNTAVVEVYAISIGRGDWNTPLTETKVVTKIEDPVWFPPQSIRDEHAAKGKSLPLRVPAGPNNPLGKYVIQLDLPGYFIHGTDKSFGIGMQVTHGCMRMYPEDIKSLTFNVPNGTSVKILNQRFKAGWMQDDLYLEVHPPLDSSKISAEQQNFKQEQLAQQMTKTLIRATEERADYQIDWDRVELARKEARGVPVLVGKKLISKMADSRQAANH